MQHVEKTIDIAVPIGPVYEQWTQFEDFPKFMAGVKSVCQLDDVHLVWVGERGGQDVGWTARITHQEPQRHLEWRSSARAAQAGSVYFAPLTPASTRVTLRLEFEADDALEGEASARGGPARRLEDDLRKFKDFIEGRARGSRAPGERASCGSRH